MVAALRYDGSVSDDTWMRLLALVCRELSAEDGRVEIGGQPPPADGRHLWVPLGAHRRLVAVFAEPLGEPEEARTRLAALAEAFADTAKVAAPEVTRPTRLTLNDELAALCDRAGARCAVVIDASSPVVWGRSHAELGLAGDIDRWLAAASALERAEALLGGLREVRARAIDEVKLRLGEDRQGEAAAALTRVAAAWDLAPDAFARWARCGKTLIAIREHVKGLSPRQLGGLRLVRRANDGGFYARGLASVYQLILVFDVALSEPRVEGAVRRICPVLEKLIAALPPIEPPPLRGLRLLRTD